MPVALLVTVIVTVAAAGGDRRHAQVEGGRPAAGGGTPVVPTHVPPITEDATVIPVKLSVKRALVSAVALALPRVKVMVDVPPAPMVAGAKALAMVVGASTTSCAVLETAPTAASTVVHARGVVVVGARPTSVTEAVIVQDEPAGRLPTLTLKVAPPAVAVVVTAVQVPPTASGVAFTRAPVATG